MLSPPKQLEQIQQTSVAALLTDMGVQELIYFGPGERSKAIESKDSCGGMPSSA